MKKNIMVLILSKKVTKTMYDKYSEYIKNYDLCFITDIKSYLSHKNIIYYPTDKTIRDGYSHMTSFKKCSAWDKCIKYINENNNYDYYWILEDDVYINNTFENIIGKYDKDPYDFIYSSWLKSYDEGKNWSHWNKGYKYFKKKNLNSSINQFCRLSKELIIKIIKFKNKYKRLIFHEILIVTLVVINKMIKHKIDHKNISISALDYRGYLSTKDKILYYKNMDVVHPIKEWYV